MYVLLSISACFGAAADGDTLLERCYSGVHGSNCIVEYRAACTFIRLQLSCVFKNKKEHLETGREREMSDGHAVGYG